VSPRHRKRGEEALPIGEIARKLLRRKRFHEKGKYGALVDAWQGLVGEAMAERTHIRAFKEGDLLVQVDSPALLHELNGFLKQQLLEGLQATKAGRDVASLRLCLGPVAGDGQAGDSRPAGRL
jgi:hypothetical protein